MPQREVPQDPQTPQEWQEAADLANLYLQLQAAASYGLVVHGLQIDEARCAALLERARERGYTPRPAQQVLKEILG